MTSNNLELWERIINQIHSSTTRQVLKDHMTIDKVSDSEVYLIHDNNMIAKTMLEKERKEIEASLEKEFGKKVTLNIQGMTKEEYFQRLMGIDHEDYDEELYKNTEDKIWKKQNKTEKHEDNKEKKENILKLFFFDTETTGRNRGKHYIIQFGGIAGELNSKTLEFKETKRINQFINPPINEDEFEKKAIETHHIHKRDLIGYSDITRYIRDFLKLIKDADYVVGHNVDFDKNFLMGECERNKIKFDDNEVKWIDTMKPSREIVKALDKRGIIKNPNLLELHTYLFGKGFDGAHDAMADITATKDCFIELIKKYGLFKEILNEDKKRTSYQITRIEDNYNPFDKMRYVNIYDSFYRIRLTRILLREIEPYLKALDKIESDYIKGLELIKFRNRYIHIFPEKIKYLEREREYYYEAKRDFRKAAYYTEEICTLIARGFDKLKEINEVIRLNNSIIKNYYEQEKKIVNHFKEFLEKYSDTLEGIKKEVNYVNHNAEEDEDLDDGNNLVITPENLPFSKMKQLMTIVSGNPGNITIQVLGNEMSISKKGLDELKKLIRST